MRKRITGIKIGEIQVMKGLLSHHKDFDFYSKRDGSTEPKDMILSHFPCISSLQYLELITSFSIEEEIEALRGHELASGHMARRWHQIHPYFYFFNSTQLNLSKT